MDSSAKQCAQLLSQLERDDIASVLRSQQFNNAILQHCFILGAQLTLQVIVHKVYSFFTKIYENEYDTEFQC